MSNEHVVSMKEHCLNVIEEVFEPAMDWLSDTVMSSEFQNDIKEFNCQESGPYLVPVTFSGVESPLKAIKFFFINVDESVIFAYTLDVCDHFQIKFDMFASSFNELGERLKSDETRSEMKKSLIAQLDKEEFAQLLNDYKFEE